MWGVGRISHIQVSNLREPRSEIMSNVGPVVAVTCLSFEARIAAGPGIHVLCGNAMQQASKLDSTMKLGGRGIISIGIAGGLDPGLAPGLRRVLCSSGPAQLSVHKATSSCGRESMPSPPP